ncbi:uncharacterized protein M421DRAFT_224907 [Didymella exigua CBS 183.55]|uniref:Aerobic respiration control sensor protein arcB n=1 Tax=Didymella exigua CBS 183.55 TaxID=1150837 RepID=A0A6A5RCY3_9PLEO|nr:uncharacterized protein M421DRAFT_224907 [Didymella exigua CBS 183.55]KAF1926105.1 hypothetical protein M421DRAFT_224907 [Didymella exigua CBS 183.55]
MDMELPLRPQLPHNSSSNDPEFLHDLGLLDLLENDPRPTFALDTTSARNSVLGLYPVFSNAALEKSGTLWGAISGSHDNHMSLGEDATSVSHFRNWSCRKPSTLDKPLTFCGHSWTRCLIAQRWIVVSGQAIKAGGGLKANERSLSKKISRSNFATFDWTDDPPPAKLSPHVAWARSIDWENTPLGPMREWSPQLRSNASLIMMDPRAAVGFYGPELIMIYNEPYIELLGGLHPCIGRSAREALAQVWNEFFEPIIKRNLAGETVDNSHTEIPLVRNGYLEETYFSTRFIPIFDSQGATIGHYEPVVESTKEVLLERRLGTLMELSQELPRARDSNAYWDHAVQVFSRNSKDVSSALFYSTEADTSSQDSTTIDSATDSQYQCKLRRSIGAIGNPVSRIDKLDLREFEGTIKLFKKAIIADLPITVDLLADPDAQDLAKALRPQGSDDVCKLAVICPLHLPSSKETILGFMVIGLSPRRPYDKAYSQFIYEAARLVSASLTSLILHEKDIGRREKAITTAELIKTELRQQLAESQLEVDRGHTKFQRFAERSNIGIFILNMDGVYSYRNEAWYNILCSNEDTSYIELEQVWNDLIDNEYIASGQAMFEALAATKEAQSFELRLKNTWRVASNSINDSLPEIQPKWVLCSIFPELSEEGEILEIIGCITEISQQKWGEELQAIQATQAKESKKQLESFIDTTSHEMRNPLSAIVQCADSIISSHEILKGFECCEDDYQTTLLATLDCAETIVQCSKHMKTIVDDVLTMSKLDSGLFTMTPIDVELESTARDAVKMFEGEARAAGVHLQLHMDDSCKQHNLARVSLDPTRVLQILINLLTNAIKFTRLEAKREIIVTLSVALTRPTHNADGRVSYIPRSSGHEAKTLLADWEQGQSVFVRFSVQDTGTGMTDAQHHLLFTRFSQASPRTHIDYGGSGLGLFISRRLTEMHGGAIGFTSRKGVGSTFSFYVQSRCSSSAMQRRETVDPDSTTVDGGLQAHRTLVRSKSCNETTPHPSPTSTPTGHVPDSDLHILIVEDNLVNQRVLAKQLRDGGMKVAVANHGGEALEYLRTTWYCKGDGTGKALTLILMDWEMPVMNGLECVASIRAMQAGGAVNGHVPVIAVTANVRSEQVETALQAGMDDVISKPFRIPELRACIQKTLRTVAPAETVR